MKKQDKARLRMWQERLSRAESEYSAEYSKMVEREAIYAGTNRITPVVRGSLVTSTPHVRNICAEIVEAEVDNNIPQPKVTPLHREDERLAQIIEDMLKNELDRMPFERLNDQLERTVPVQGGAGILLEWDNSQQTHETSGELAITLLHPRMILPQDGVSEIAEMDYIFLKLPQTKAYIKTRYGVDVSDEAEAEPDVRSTSSDSPADDLVTQYVAYYRNSDCGIGLYSWVNDQVLEDIDDYQARRLRHCAVCGAREPVEDVKPLELPTLDGTPPEEGTRQKRDKKACPYCGSSEWTSENEEFEEIYNPIVRSDGTEIPGAQPVLEESGEVDELGVPASEIRMEPTRVPYYKPDIYPLTLQRNISTYGCFLGDSDIDRIRTHQNTINRIEAKIIEKLCSAGSYLTLPDDARIEVNDKELKIVYPGSQANKAMIDVVSTEADISQDLAYLAQVYEEARQLCGITDSFQGRKDATATSGKAKEFAASQSAGRLESKRVAKDAAYAELYEAMFKFKLAYADEPRPVVSRDFKGRAQYGEFNRYDFLKQDANGEWYWNDRFLFSCDSSSGLSQNRQAMWEETRSNLTTGAFGDPSDLKTLILFWNKMELLHYPGAGETRAYLEEELRNQQQLELQQLKIQQVQAGLTRARQKSAGASASVGGDFTGREVNGNGR